MSKTCGFCGAEMEDKSKGQTKKWCSPSCTKKAWRASKTPEQRKLIKKNEHLLSRYGITLDDYNLMMVYQSDRCAICLTDDKGKRDFWSVDHDHQTGKVRGLLCSTCNTGLGHFDDDADNLIAAKTYLEASNK